MGFLITKLACDAITRLMHRVSIGIVLLWIAILLLSGAQRPKPVARAGIRGTDSLPVAVKLLNSGKSQGEITNEAEQLAAAKDAARSTMSLARASLGLTLVLVLVTAAAVVVAALQWRTLVAQKEAMVDQHARMLETVRSAGRQELLIERQLAALELQGRTMAESVQLAYEQFIVANPPDLTIVNISLDEDVWDAEGHPSAEVRFLVVNKGNSSAQIVECSWRAVLLPTGTHALPPIPEYADVVPDDPLIGVTLQRGEERLVSVGAGGLAFTGIIRNVMPNAYTVGLVGWIRYRDRSLRSRKLGFCYVLTPGAVAFVPAGGSDYQYSH